MITITASFNYIFSFFCQIQYDSFIVTSLEILTIEVF